MPRKHHFGWAGPVEAEARHDPRDILYAVSPHVLRALPPSVDLRPKYTAPVFNQGALGSCGPNAAAGDILYDELQDPSPDVMPSRLFVYYNTRVLMGTVNSDSGVINRDLVKALATYGWCDERTWPYDIGTFRQQPSQAAYAEAAQRKIVRYERVAQSLDVMKGALAQGDPFILGFTCYQSLESPQTSATGDIPLPRPGEQVIGGHDILPVGYDDSRQVFIIRNSWGQQWGQNGYGTIPYAYATSPRLSGDFWSVHWGDHQPPTPPVPPPNPPVPPPSPPPAPPVPDWTVLCPLWRSFKPQLLAYADTYIKTLPAWEQAIAQMAKAMAMKKLDATCPAGGEWGRVSCWHDTTGES